MALAWESKETPVEESESLPPSLPPAVVDALGRHNFMEDGSLEAGNAVDSRPGDNVDGRGP